MTVFLHEGSAAGAIHHNRFVTVTEGCDVRARQGSCFICQSRMRVQRAAAHLATHFPDIIAVYGEGANGGIVDVREEAILDAAPE
jgi:hypothetical protein